MIKKITTLVSANKNQIIKKSVVVASVVGGLILGVLLARPEEEIVLEGEIVEEDDSITETSPED